MTGKYQNKYRVSSIRLQNWDYGWNAAYFITICTQNRQHYFGDVVDGKMRLSPIGILADVFWHEIKNHTKNVELGAFVVMPNHVHGILILNSDGVNNDNKNINGIGGNVGDDNINVCNNDGVVVGTRHALSLLHDPRQIPPQQTIGQKRFQNQGKNTVSSIVGSYKSAVTKHAHRLDYNFAWQARFYEHIIRNIQSLERIEKYIINNPTKWSNDRFRAPRR